MLIDVVEGELRNTSFVGVISAKFGDAVSNLDGLRTWAVLEDSSSKDSVFLEALLKRTRAVLLSTFATVLVRQEEKVFGLRGPVVELFVRECSARCRIARLRLQRVNCHPHA